MIRVRDTVESQCSRFWQHVVTEFNTTVQTFCDWFWRIRMRPHDWQAGFFYIPALAHITLSAQSSSVLH